METNESYDAATALRDVQSARGQAATRIAAPPYYYPALGLLSAFVVAAEAFSSTLGSIGCMTYAVGCALLINRHQEKTRMGMWGARGPAGRRFLWICVGWGVFFIALVCISIWVQRSHHPTWWGLPLGLLAFASTMIVGKVYEPRMLQRIRTGDATPTNIR